MIICGDCEKVVSRLEDESVDLIVTSPPYADQRKSTYGGIEPENYSNWFLPKSKEFFRVLKLDGTFILNIKENVTNGERNIYVINLILELRKQGWLWTEEFVWHKRNSPPGKWPNRFRDGWERCLQFNKSRKFKMYQDAVMVPTSEATRERASRLTTSDRIRQERKTGSGFGMNQEKCCNRELAYPSNVLHLATECSNRKHSAAYPESLPRWFIKLFTIEGDTVLDPFSGSGTTGVVCKQENRVFIGIDKEFEYVNDSIDRIKMSTRAVS